MKVAGFTFIRNSVKYDYPVVEAILSILPLCDEFFVLVGNSEDNTLEQINGIGSPKIKIFHSIWDETLTKDGGVLANETNKCMDLIPEGFDWLFYIQGDEVVHEKYLPIIQERMALYCRDGVVEGLLFDYTHFYGNYSYIGDSRNWYRNEIRVIKNDKQIRSYRDAQGFRKNGRKLNVKSVAAHIFHYGYIRNPKSLFLKSLEMAKYYRTEKEYGEYYKAFIAKYENEFDFSEIDSLQIFEGLHPKVMHKRIEETDWRIELNIKRKKFKNFGVKFLYYFEKITGKRLFEYKNYRII